MIALLAYYWYGLLLSLAIGLITAWWVWGYREPVALVEFDPDNEPIVWPPREPTPPPPDPRPRLVAVPDEPSVEEMAPAGFVEVVEVANDVVPANDADDLGPAIAASLSGSGEEATSAPTPPPDDLTLIRGIGPQLDALLRSLGVERFADIAGWMPDDIERIGDDLGEYKIRIIRDEWIGQARLLARGDMETFNQRYGHLS